MLYNHFLTANDLDGAKGLLQQQHSVRHTEGSDLFSFTHFGVWIGQGILGNPTFTLIFVHGLYVPFKVDFRYDQAILGESCLNSYMASDLQSLWAFASF
jgi:hypothetical protein